MCVWTSQLIDFHEVILLGGAGGGVFRRIGQNELGLFILFFDEHWRTGTGTL